MPMKLGVREKNDRESRMGDVPSEANVPSDTHVLVAGNTAVLYTILLLLLAMGIDHGGQVPPEFGVDGR